MKDFITLVKAVQASSLSINRQKKGKVVKPHTFSFSVLLSGIFLAVMWTIQFVSFPASTLGMNLPLSDYSSYMQLTLACVILYGFFMCLTFSCSIFFRGNNDMFLSLPISGNRYFLAKLTLSLYINFIYGGLSLLSVGITACVMLNLGFLSYLVVVLLTLIYIVLTPCVAFLVVNLFANIIDFKNSKAGFTIFTSVAALIAACFVFILSYYTNVIPSDVEEISIQEIIALIDTYCGYFTWITWVGALPAKALLLVAPSDFLFVLVILGISALFIALTLLIARRSYLSKLGKTFSSKKKKLSPEEVDLKIKKSSEMIKHPKRIILIREFSNYRRDSSVIINAFIVPLILILSLAVSLYAMKFSGTFEEDPTCGQMIALGFVAFNSNYCILPYTSLSLEKKDLILIKTLPMNMKSLLNMKLLPSFLIYLPMSILTGIIFFFGADFSFSYLIIMILFIFLYPFAIILFSFFIGVALPNFNYDHVADLLKKGWGISLCHIGYIVLAFIIFGILLVCWIFAGGILLGGLISSCLLLAIGLTFYFLSKVRLEEVLNQEITF